MNVVVIIPAKGDSRRLTKKNITELWGKPLLEWAFETCHESNMVTDIYVSTEDADIKNICFENGIKVIDRPLRLCKEAYKQAVIRHAAKQVHQFYNGDTYWVSLQANSPQVRGWHIDEALEKMIATNRDEIFSVDKMGNQNAAFRIFKGDYVFQEDLSTGCGTYVCDVVDVHDEDDIVYLSQCER